MSSQIPQRPSTAKTASILAFLRNQVIKSVYTGISILLSPCCDTAIGSINSTCVSSGYVTLVISLTNPVSLQAIGTATVVIGTTSYIGTYDNNGHVTVTNIALSGGTYTISTSIFLPTNTKADLGVYLTTTPFSYVVPSC